MDLLSRFILVYLQVAEEWKKNEEKKNEGLITEKMGNDGGTSCCPGNGCIPPPEGASRLPCGTWEGNMREKNRGTTPERKRRAEDPITTSVV